MKTKTITIRASQLDKLEYLVERGIADLIPKGMADEFTEELLDRIIIEVKLKGD